MVINMKDIFKRLTIIILIICMAVTAGCINWGKNRNRAIIHTDMYKDGFLMFDHWEDQLGKNVSSENPYNDVKKKGPFNELRPVYSRLNMNVVVNNTNKSQYIQSEYKYLSGANEDLAYTSHRIFQGTTVIFSAVGESVIFGLSDKDRISECNNYYISFNEKVFCPEYGIMFEGKNAPKQITASKEADNDSAKTYSTINIDSNTKHEFRFVFGNTVKMYIDDVLFTDPEFTEWSIDYSKNYYFTLTGKNAEYRFIEWDCTSNTEPTMLGVPLSENKYKDKTVVFLGDSITEGVGSGEDFDREYDRYSSIVSFDLDIDENNMGISGTVLCTGHESRESRLKDIELIPLDAEAVVVLLGTNDFDLAGKGFAKLGKMGDTDTKTIYGAMDAMCKALLTRFRGSKTKIYVFTPIPRQSDINNTQKCANGYTLRDLSKAYMEVCKANDIICYDLNSKSGMVESDFDNTLHPNVNGSNKIAAVIERVLLSDMEYYEPCMVK